MSRFLRFLGLDQTESTMLDSPALAAIEEKLAALPPEQSRFYAAFAYVLARVAEADLEVDPRERDAMKSALAKIAGLGESDALLVVEIAESQVEHLGASANYLVTRAFREMSTAADRIRLLECLFSVAAADDTVSSGESNEIMCVADELSVPRPQVLAIRSRYKDHLAEFKKLAGEH